MKENNEDSKISESNSEQSSSNQNQSQGNLSNKSSEKKSGGSLKDSKFNISNQTPPEQEQKKSEDNNIFQNIPRFDSRNNNNKNEEPQDNKRTNSFSNNYKIIIENLENSFKNYKGEVRSNTFQKILNNQDILEILKELCRKNLEDIAVYILNEFSIDQKKDGISGNLMNEGNEREKSFRDLFFLAIKKGQIHVLEALDKQELNYIEILDDEGNTGLILAVIYSNIQIAKFFLRSSPEMLEKKNNYGYTPLLLAVYNNDNLMFSLLANNLENVITDGNSLYELAIRNENIDIINYLNPYKNKDKCDFLPSLLLLHFAVCQSNLEVFKTIANLTKKYDYQIQSTKETPLHWAAMKGNYYIVKELIKIYKENQIELDQKNIFGVTPFMLANLRQDKYICKLFYENGVDANEQDNEGNSIAHLIAGLGDVKWLKHMIKKFNVNCYLKNNKGDTPFIHAILNENISCVEFFIELFKNSKQLVSTNINWRNKYGQTPLHAAVFTGNCRIIEILLRNKADISVFDANELTPYHYAYIEEKEDVIKTIHETLGIDKFDFIKK